MTLNRTNQLNHQVTVYKTTPIMKFFTFFSFILILFLFYRVHILDQKILQLRGKLTESQLRNELQMKGSFDRQLYHVQMDLLALEKKVEKSQALIFQEISQIGKVEAQALPQYEQSTENKKSEKSDETDKSGKSEEERNIAEQIQERLRKLKDEAADSEAAKKFSDYYSEGTKKVKGMWSDLSNSLFGDENGL